MDNNSRTIKRSILKDKAATDNVAFQGGTYRIHAFWRKDDPIIGLAKTDRGGECISEFVKYQVIDG